jgi:uroporphyrinogen decarboxylase
MNSRERVILALDHKETDRIPVDLGGHRSSGIAALAYAKLRKYLGLKKKPVRVYDMVQQLAVVDEDILDIFGVDTIEMGRGFLLEDRDWKPWILPDGSECEIPYYINPVQKDGDWLVYHDDGTELGIMRKGSLYFEQTTFPMMNRSMEVDDFHDLEDQLERNIWSAIVHPGAHLKLDDEGCKEMRQSAKALHRCDPVRR